MVFLNYSKQFGNWKYKQKLKNRNSFRGFKTKFTIIKGEMCGRHKLEGWDQQTQTNTYKNRWVTRT